MKKKIIGILLSVFSIFTVIGLAGCGTTTSNNNKLVVYTSFYPLYDFAQRVGGDNVEVINLVRPGMDAHDFELGPKQIIGMSKADLIIINGAGMETWTQKLSNDIQNKILDTSKSVHLIERTSNSDNHDDHEHEDDEDHDHGPSDPHTWLSIKNAIKQIEAIKNEFVKLDAKNAESYNNNFEAATLMLENLESSYASILSSENLATNTIVVSHRAFGYLAHEYNLVQYSISGIETDTDPVPSVMAEIIDYINNNNIKAIFYQTFVNSKAAEKIAEDTGAKLYKLSTLETLTQEEIARGENYVTIMYQNLISLKNALSIQD